MFIKDVLRTSLLGYLLVGWDFGERNTWTPTIKLLDGVVSSTLYCKAVSEMNLLPVKGSMGSLSTLLCIAG